MHPLSPVRWPFACLWAALGVLASCGTVAPTSSGAVSIQAGSMCDPYQDTALCGFQGASNAALSCDASAHVWIALSVCAIGSKCTTSTDWNGHVVPACSTAATGGGTDATTGVDAAPAECSAAELTRCTDATHYQVCANGHWAATQACASSTTCVPKSGNTLPPCEAAHTPGMTCNPANVLEGCGLVSGQPVRLTCDAASKVWAVLEVCPDGKSCAVVGLKSSCTWK